MRYPKSGTNLRRRTLLIILSFILLIFTCEDYRESASTSADLLIKIKKDKKNRAFAKAFEKHFEDLLKHKGSPGAALSLVMNDKTVIAKGFGKRDVKKSLAVDENTAFRIGSLSKGFSAVLAAKLMDEGQLSWNEKVQKHVPDFSLIDPEQANRIDLKHCLSHTIGIPKHAYTNLIERNISLERIFPKFKKIKHLKKEGTFYAYQNATFSLVEPLIKSATGFSYAETLKKELFHPLEMSNSSVSKNGLQHKNNFALPHEYSHSRKKWYPRKINDKYYNAISAGGINSSASDMAKWLDLLLGNQPEVVTPSTLDSVFHKRVPIKYEKRYYTRWRETDDSYYGLGFKIHEFKNRELIHHGGYVNGFRSEIGIDRDNKVAISVIFNAPTRLANTIIRDFYNFYDEYFADEAQP